jgi:hypothetical protein
MPASTVQLISYEIAPGIAILGRHGLWHTRRIGVTSNTISVGSGTCRIEADPVTGSLIVPVEARAYAFCHHSTAKSDEL